MRLQLKLVIDHGDLVGNGHVVVRDSELLLHIGHTALHARQRVRQSDRDVGAKHLGVVLEELLDALKGLAYIAALGDLTDLAVLAHIGRAAEDALLTLHGVVECDLGAGRVLDLHVLTGGEEVGR